MKRRLVPLVAALASLAGCGQQNSYDEAEDAVRSWLSVANEGDPAACDLMTEMYREDVVSVAGLKPAAPCEQAIRHLARSKDDAVWPAAESDIEIPVWDPSGEAIAEVTDPRTERVVEFWLQYENNTWLVAGQVR